MHHRFSVVPSMTLEQPAFNLLSSAMCPALTTLCSAGHSGLYKMGNPVLNLGVNPVCLMTSSRLDTSLCAGLGSHPGTEGWSSMEGGEHHGVCDSL